jgi:hypothetical protein
VTLSSPLVQVSWMYCNMIGTPSVTSRTHISGLGLDKSEGFIPAQTDIILIYDSVSW